MPKQPAYPFDIPQSSTYTFLSEGKRSITKVVDFSFTGIESYVCAGLGDVLEDGSVDEEVISNNGDLGRLLGTLIQILLDYTAKFPKAVLFIAGIDERRTQLYWRTLRLYGRVLNRDFRITGLLKEEGGFRECSFNTISELDYVAFLIRKKTPVA